MSNFVVLDFFEVCRDGDAGARVWVVVPGVVISHYPRRVNPDFEETAVSRLRPSSVWKVVCGRQDRNEEVRPRASATFLWFDAGRVGRRRRNSGSR